MNLMLKLSVEQMDLGELKKYFGVTSSGIIPRIKELEDRGLIIKNNGEYCLTPIGTVMAKNLKTMSELSFLIEKNGQFFNNHDLSPIPEHLLYRIGELGKCKLVENDAENVNASFREVLLR
jgi:predicted transcriptional regulator